MRALIVAAGAPSDRAALDRTWPGWSAGVGLVVAADGGADLAGRLGLEVDLAVGDFDSIGPSGLDGLRAAGVPVEVAPTAKNESDTELAIRAAVARGADALSIVGGLGGRPDHLLANVGLLALMELSGRPIELIDDSTRVSLLSGPASREFTGRPGDLVSLLPLGPGVEGVTTTGLAWALDHEPLPVGPARGLSNVRIGAVATVGLRAGLLVVVESVAPSGPAGLDPIDVR